MSDVFVWVIVTFGLVPIALEVAAHPVAVAVVAGVVLAAWIGGLALIAVHVAKRRRPTDWTDLRSP